MNTNIYNAAREAALWRDLSHFGRFVFCGKDAAALLHHLTTADIKKLKANSGTDAALITSKGRLIDVLSIFRREDGVFFVVTSPNRRDVLAPHARKFILYKQEVLIENSAESGALMGIFGPEAARVLARSGAPMEDDFSGGEVRNFPFENEVVHFATSRRLPHGGFLLWCENHEVLQKLARESGALFCDNETYNVLRIESGVPVAGLEITESFNPWEAGLDAAISLAKGCYNGQEIVARLNTYQKVKRRLCGLRLGGALEPNKNYTLKSGTRDAGILTSSAHSPRFGNIALAYVRGDFSANETLQVVDEQSTLACDATVCELPFPKS
jgi:folate-binding protein YgfZ